MKPDAIKKQIIFGSQKAGKTYTFDEEHDETLPAEMWLQESDEGLILFIVFYTQACRWSRCLGCNLPSKVSQDHVPYKSLMAQIDHIFVGRDVRSRASLIRKVIISNNGSVLDEDTFSSTALMYLIAQLNLNFPNLSVLSMESRPEYVDLSELEFISRALAEGDTPTQLEIAIGFEAFDNRIRNEVFDKGLSLEAFEGLVVKMAPFGYHLKCYFMQKPVPGISDVEAVGDIHHAIDYLSQIANTHDILINMHLNPTYVATGTALEPAFWEGRYSPPLLEDVAEAARYAREKSISTFIGLSDEGLAVEGGSFLLPDSQALVEKLELFNRSHDFNILDEICKTRKEGEK
jgi:radical SAM enzyme (TIGR01210 family)